MAVLLFKLRGVPDDEAEEVRSLLVANGIEYYETSAGKWGISMPGIWLPDETRLESAQALIEAYQEARTARVRTEYQRLRQAGGTRTLLDAILDNPVRFLLYLAAAAALGYLSVYPFFSFR